MGKLADKHIILDKELWDLSHNNYCGFLVNRKVMQLVMKKITKFNEDIKEILLNNIDDIYTSSWTCHTIKKDEKILKQKTIKYANINEDNFDKEQRLRIYSTNKPICVEEVFNCENHEMAEEIAKELCEEEMKQEEDKDLLKAKNDF